MVYLLLIGFAVLISPLWLYYAVQRAAARMYVAAGGELPAPKPEWWHELLDKPGTTCECGCGQTIPVPGSWMRDFDVLRDMPYETLCWLGALTERGFRIDAHLNLYAGPDATPGAMKFIDDRIVTPLSRITPPDPGNSPFGYTNWLAANGHASRDYRPRPTSTGSGSGL